MATVATRKILALLFDLKSTQGKTAQLIAWPDATGNGEFLRAEDPARNLLQMRTGDSVIFKDRYRLTVVRVKPWRTTECRDDTAYDWVESGATWEAV